MGVGHGRTGGAPSNIHARLQAILAAVRLLLGSGRIDAITDRDIAMRVVAKHESASAPVERMMTREIVACRPTDTRERAEHLMSRAKVSRIMCPDESGRLVGVISLSDVAQVEEGAQAAQTLHAISSREVQS